MVGPLLSVVYMRINDPPPNCPVLVQPYIKLYSLLMRIQALHTASTDRPLSKVINDASAKLNRFKAVAANL
jgi:hypothetical protein